MRIILTNQHCDNRGDQSATIGLLESIYSQFGNDTKIDMFKQTKKHRFLTEEYNVAEYDMITQIGGLLQLFFWGLFKAIGADIRKILSQDAKKTISLYEKCDLVLSSCGGAYIGDIYAKHEIVHILYLVIPLLLKKKIVFAAPSIGPFRKKSMNPFRKWILKHAERIVVRDPISYEYVQKFINAPDKIFMAADACFAQRMNNERSLEERENKIGFTPLDYSYPHAEAPFVEKENYKSSIVRLIDDLMREDETLKFEFFPQLYNEHTDMPLIEEIIGRLKYPERAEVFSNALSGIEQQKEIAKMKMMIATRYHSAVFACKMLVPCVCIAYEHKAEGLMRMFHMEDCLIDIRSVTYELLKEKVEYVEANKERIYQRLNEHSDPVYLAANRTAEIAKDAWEMQSTLKNATVQFYDDILRYPYLCKNCGMCKAVCPTESIYFSTNIYGEILPRLSETTCVDCGKCRNACCARTLRGEKGATIFGKNKGMYLVESTDIEQHKSGSSGGAVTALLEYGIQSGYFEEVLTVSHKNDPIVAGPVYTDQATGTSGSKYISAPLCAIYDKQRNAAITALPCQASAIRKQSQDDFIMGLFCSKLSTEKLIDFMAWKAQMKKGDIDQVVFRDGVWPGAFMMKTKDREFRCNLGRSVFAAAYNSYLFANQGCLYCNDYFCEDADLSFGDPWGRKQYEDEYYGQTVIIVRTERGEELLRNAERDGKVKVTDIPWEDVLNGHVKEIYSKKTSVSQRIRQANSRCGNRFQIGDDALIGGKISKRANRFMIYNNQKIKDTIWYSRIKKVPSKFLFVYRYANAFLLNRFLRRNHLKTQYFNTAKEEYDNKRA